MHKRHSVLTIDLSCLYLAASVVDDQERILNLLRGLAELVNHFNRLVMCAHAIVHAVFHVLQFDVVGISQSRVADVLLYVKLSVQSELGGVLRWLDNPGFHVGIVLVNHRFSSGEVHWKRIFSLVTTRKPISVSSDVQGLY